MQSREPYALHKDKPSSLLVVPSGAQMFFWLFYLRSGLKRSGAARTAARATSDNVPNRIQETAPRHKREPGRQHDGPQPLCHNLSSSSYRWPGRKALLAVPHLPVLSLMQCSLSIVAMLGTACGKVCRWPAAWTAPHSIALSLCWTLLRHARTGSGVHLHIVLFADLHIEISASSGNLFNFRPGPDLDIRVPGDVYIFGVSIQPRSPCGKVLSYCAICPPIEGCAPATPQDSRIRDTRADWKPAIPPLLPARAGR